jgi:hypothetical protein
MQKLLCLKIFGNVWFSIRAKHTTRAKDLKRINSGTIHLPKANNTAFGKYDVRTSSKSSTFVLKARIHASPMDLRRRRQQAP